MEFSDILTDKWKKLNEIISDISIACNMPNFSKMEKKTKDFIKMARKLRDYIKKLLNNEENIVTERLEEMIEFCHGLIEAVNLVCNPKFCNYSATKKARTDICEDFIETVNPVIEELGFLYDLSNVKPDGLTYVDIKTKGGKKSKKKMKN